MSSLNMKGFYELDEETIELIVENKIGNYALGYINSRKNFVPKYVGRVDKRRLAKRLKEHLEEYEDCTHFMFSYAQNSKEAFEKECRNYHDFEKQLHNTNHPDKPDHTDYECPVADCEEE